MIREFHQISLRGRNSFGVDQRAARLVEFETAEDLRTFFAAGIPGRWTVLAGGNNILFTEDYDGVLLTPVARQIALLSDDGDEVRLRVEAGVEWDDLVEWAVERGLWGIENLSLIPGKAGSAPVQNIGAYGCEAKDAIRRVEMYCVETGTLLTLDAAHCGFGYRESVFKHDLKGRVIITAIEIRLSHTPRPKLGYGDVEREVEARGGATLRNIREAICSIRRAKLPDPAVLGNAGSFFKNPVVEAPVAERLLAEYPDMPHYAAPEGRVKLAAGWLIDRAGMKGYREGSVGVHERQALVLVNHGGATGGEVIAFARTVLTGISTQVGKVIRPLLFASRKEILEYAVQNRIPFREDSSNRSTKYLRNKIRLGLIPRIREINPKFTSLMSRNLARLTDAQLFINHGIERIRSEAVTSDTGIDTIHLDRLDPAFPQGFVIYELLSSGYGFKGDVIDALCHSLEQDATGRRFYARERVASIDRGKIVIAPIAPDDACLTTVRKGAPRSYCGNSVLYYEYCDIDTIKNFGVPENIAQIDADRLQFPLTLRRWRDGDWFVPFGMTGRKKVSDFLVDAKVSVAEKQRQFVLLSGDEIVWLVGRRIDDRYRLTPGTENVLRITKEIV